MDLIPFLFLLLVFLSALVYLLFIIFRWIYRKGHKKVAVGIPAAIIVYLTYSIYTAIYPDDAFYHEEFKTVTLRDLPQSAKIIAKDASYPDQHGEYCSVALIKLSQKDYNNLRNQIINDKRFAKGELYGSEELDNVMGKGFDEKKIMYQFNRMIPGHIGNYLHLSFLNDKQSIICYVIND